MLNVPLIFNRLLSPASSFLRQEERATNSRYASGRHVSATSFSALFAFSAVKMNFSLRSLRLNEFVLSAVRDTMPPVFIACLCRRRRWLLIGWLWMWTVAAFGSEADSTWYERSWQSAEGLPDNSVSGL